MNKLSEVVLKPLKKSFYIKPFTLSFVQNGKKRTWDFLSVHDSVSVVLYNVNRKVLLFVKQFRPLVYIGSIPKEDRQGEISVEKYPAELGVTLELCAGIVDKDLPLEEITAEEVLEECGYRVDAAKLEKVSSFRSGMGRTGSIQTLFYCEVTDEMKVNEGGGVDHEMIDVVEMTVPEVKELIRTPYIPSPPGFLFAIYWFLANKVH